MVEMETFQPALLLLAALASASGAQEIIYAEVGQTVTLRPPKGFKSHKFYLQWNFNNNLEVAWSNYMNGNSVTADHSWAGTALSDSSLIVKNMREGQFGTYECRERNNLFRVTYRVLRLTVSAEPSSEVLLGQTVTLRCDAENPSGLQRPEVRWLNPQGEGVARGTHVVKTGPGDDGQWTCVVKVGEKTSEARVSVTVVDLRSPPAVYTSASSPLNIPCSVSANIPWERIRALGLKEGHWEYFPGSQPAEAQRLFTLSPGDPVSWKEERSRGLTPASDLRNPNLSLHKKPGGSGDRGVYVCTLEFDNGQKLSKTVRVEVLEITSSPGAGLVAGQPFNLSCGLGVPLTSDLHLKWIPPEKSSLGSPLGRHLAVPAAAARHGGRWRCELWRSDERLTTALIMLKIEPWMSAWMLVIICGAAAIAVLLLLILVFVLRRRRRAQKSRHGKRRLCQCKNPKPKGFYRT